MLRLFTDHPKSVGESYGEHLVCAGSFGLRMMVAGAACALHGIFPFLFVKTGSTMVRRLHGEMVSARETRGGLKPTGFREIGAFDPVV
jgi:hypothetical protein